MPGVLLPPPCQQSCFPHRALSVCVEAWGEDGTGQRLSTEEKQTLEVHGHPQASFELAYLPITAKASPQASHCVPCCATSEGSGSTSTMQQRHLSGNSRFDSSLADSSAQGNIFGQLGARRTLAPWALAKSHAHQQRQKLLLSQSGKFTSTAVSLEHRPYLPMVHEEAVRILWRPGCWHLWLLSAN